MVLTTVVVLLKVDVNADLTSIVVPISSWLLPASLVCSIGFLRPLSFHPYGPVFHVLLSAVVSNTGMAFSFGIGDAVILSTIALCLGQAFSSGRKSAPSEFREVQDLLYNLGKALEILGQHAVPPLQNDNPIVSEGTASNAGDPTSLQDNVLAQMMLNCSGVLKHLETLVDRYMELDETRREIELDYRKRWRRDLLQNWKKIRWTTEGGNLDKLKNTLTVHINGLNMAITALNRSVQAQLVILIQSMAL